MPSKKKRTVRKRTRAWRKAIDPTIANYTINKTTKLLQGGSVKDKKDEELFVIDKKPKYITRKERMLIAMEQKTKYEKAIDPYPQIAPISVPKISKKRKGYEMEIEKLANQLKRRKLSDESLTKTKKETFDIWGDDSKKDEKKTENENDSDSEEEKKKKKSTKALLKKKIKLNKFERVKTSDLPAVEIPDEGSSYNPPKESHQELLKKAVDEELRKRKKIDKVLDAIKVKKQYEGVYVTEDDDQEDNEEVDDVEKEHVNIGFLDRKTRSQINKEKRKKKIEASLKRRRMRKELITQANNLKTIKDEVDKIETKTKAKEERKKFLAKRPNTKTSNFGHEKLPKPPIAVLLPSQVPSQLRHFRPKHDVLADRYFEFHRRNILAPKTRKKFSRKYPLVYEYRHDHKAFYHEQQKLYADL